MASPDGNTPEPEGIAGLREALRRRIEAIPQCVASLEGGYPVYDGAIRRGRLTSVTDPEEVVRALFVIHLVHDLRYPPESLWIEYPVRARAGRGAGDKYADVAIVRKENGAESAYALMELKTEDRFGIERNEAWESQLFGLAQFETPRPDALVYGTAHPNSGAAVLEMQVVSASQRRDHRSWADAGQIIDADSVSANYGKPSKEPYVKGGGKDLRQEVTVGELDGLRVALHDVLWGGGGSTDTDVFNLLTRLILAKITDERATQPGEKYRFQTLEGEPLSASMERIDVLYREGLVSRLNFSEEQATEKRAREAGKGTDAQIRYAIERLERYNLFALANSASGADILGDFFERIMRQGFKQDKGQFFTHANIADFIVQALDVEEWSAERARRGEAPPRIIDPSAGSGTFLIKAMERIFAAVQGLRDAEWDKLNSGAREIINRTLNQERRHAWAGDHCYGLEINPDLGLAAQINMLLHADGSSSIFSGPQQGDGLAPFSQYPSSRPELSDSSPHAIYPRDVSEHFDAVVSNPPFSVKYTDDELARYAKCLAIAAQTKASEALFLDRWFQLLKPGGRLGVVVPNSLLDGVKSAARDHLLRHFWVRAVVSLPADAFYPYTSTKTSLVFAQKKTADEMADRYGESASEHLRAHPPILFARANYLGYQRTAKSERGDDRNDLSGILERFRRERIWSPPHSAGGAIAPADLLRGRSLRLDADYALSQTGVASPIPSREAFFIADADPEPGEPETSYRYCEIGDIDRMGRISPRIIDPEQTDADEDGGDGKQTDRVRSKVRKGDIMSLDDWHVLVPTTRVYLGKFTIVTGEEDCYFTTKLHPFSPGERLLSACGGDRGTATSLLFLMLRGEFRAFLASLSRWGKTYPTLNAKDLTGTVIDGATLTRSLSPERIDQARRMRDAITESQRIDRRLASLLQEQ